METILWFALGIVTAYLMYSERDKLPIFKIVLVILFGGLSFIVWLLFNMKTEVDNWFKFFRPKSRKTKRAGTRKKT